MDEFEKEKQGLFQLIESWEEENIKIAGLICHKNAALKAAVEERYLPMIVNLLGGHDLKMLLKFKERKIRDRPETLQWQPTASDLEVIKNLPIPIINFNRAGLKKVPEWVFHMTCLEELWLNNNAIKALPESIGNLKQLRSLNIENNKLKELPAAITALEKLEFLQLKNNQIEALPEDIGSLTQLKKLNADYNFIEKLPDSIGELTNLEWLCLEKNKITALPLSAQKLDSLSWLSIEGSPLGKKHKHTYGMFVTTKDTAFQVLFE